MLLLSELLFSFKTRVSIEMRPNLKKRQTTVKTRKSPEQDRAKLTVSSIIEAAARIFEKKGILGFNTNLVAELAGVGVGTLYEYFPNKEAILLKFIEREIDRDLASIEALLSKKRDQSFEDLTEDIVVQLLTLIQKRKRFRVVFFQQLPKLSYFEPQKIALRKIEKLLLDEAFSRFPKLTQTDFSKRLKFTIHAVIGILFIDALSIEEKSDQLVKSELKGLIIRQISAYFEAN